MLIQVHTNHVVRDSEALAGHAEAEVTAALERFRVQVTRVEVFLSDVNGHKEGDRDKRCVMEARPAGHQPVAVSHEAATWPEAISRATEKLEASLERMTDRLGHRKGSTPTGGEPTI
jgi:hypothetical protein